jgi:small subunit ribosomal protein S2
VQFPIAGNDDAIRSSALLTRIIADACADGLLLRASRSPGRGAAGPGAAGDPAGDGWRDAAEPKAAWEIELERQQAAEKATKAAGEPADAAARSTARLPGDRAPAPTTRSTAPEERRHRLTPRGR